MPESYALLVRQFERICKQQGITESSVILAAQDQLMGAALELLSAAQERCSNGLSLAETTLVFHALTCADALRRALEDRS